MDVLVKKFLIKKGAEANLYLGSFMDIDVIIKERIPKGYRSPRMDSYVRRFRTIHEARLLISAKKVGVPTPFVYLIDENKALLVMDYVQGKVVKNVVHQMGDEDRHRLFFEIGSHIARLHVNGIVHGDLTTSNMILSNGVVYFIDFGLGNYSSELEDQGVDLHLMLRTLESSHYQIYVGCRKSLEEGYESIAGRDLTTKVLERVKEIRRRGRYVGGKG